MIFIILAITFIVFMLLASRNVIHDILHGYEEDLDELYFDYITVNGMEDNEESRKEFDNFLKA